MLFVLLSELFPHLWSLFNELQFDVFVVAGKCKNGDKCRFVHDPNKVAVCTRYILPLSPGIPLKCLFLLQSLWVLFMETMSPVAGRDKIKHSVLVDHLVF